MHLSHRGVVIGILMGLSLTWGIESTQAQEPKFTPLKVVKSVPLGSAPSRPVVTQSQPKAQPPQPFKALFDVVVNQFKRVPKHAITRASDPVCAIAPGLLETENKIFSDRPLFVWRGSVDSIEVQEYWTPQIRWSQTIAPGVTTQRYSGPPLEAGQKYVWILKRGQIPLVTKEFIVMTQEDQGKIAQQKALEANLHGFAPSNLSDAAYFAKHSLWSDALASLSQSSEERGSGILEDQIHLLAERQCHEQVAAELALKALL